MGPSFNEQFDQHGVWRREFAQQIKRLGEWMSSHELMDAAVQERLHRLEEQVRSDKVMVAFVAEFSRGKSELINAIFFADYGRRIMPASAGRTTMCPTELFFDPRSERSYIRLLPIETRMTDASVAQFKRIPRHWVNIPLDPSDPDNMALAFAQVVWFFLARTLPPIASTLSVMLIPVIGVFSGAWWLGEVLHWQDWTAVALMVVAIATVLWPARK